MTQHAMPTNTMTGRKIFLWIYFPLFALSFNVPAIAGAPMPGAYCPSQSTRLAIAGDLAVSLDLTMKSRAAQMNKDSTSAISDLASAKDTLFMAASHGAAARTILIIDTIIQAKLAEDYARMLATWFPLLHASLQTLPNDATVQATGDLIDQAEEFMQGEREGDPMDILNQARHMLACDGLDIPLQKAIQTQSSLIKHFGKNTKAKAYDRLLNALHSTLSYALKSSDIRT